MTDLLQTDSAPSDRHGTAPQSGDRDDSNIEFSPSDRVRPGLSGRNGLLLGMGLGILLTVVGTRLSASDSGAQPPPPTPAANAIAPSQSITVASVEPTPIAKRLEATGSVAAFELVSVSTQASGRQVVSLSVDEGDFVEQGQLLARLDDSRLQAQLQQAQANVAEAEARLAELRAGTRAEELARAQENVTSAEAEVVRAESNLELADRRVERNTMLEAEGAVTRDRLDEAVDRARTQRAALEQARADLRESRQLLQELTAGPRRETLWQAEARLSGARADEQLVRAQLQDTRVVAPTSGKIAERQASIGDVVSTGETLFEIVDRNRLELRLRVPETQLDRIEIGQPVEIRSQVNRDWQVTGTVREIDPVIEEASRQAIVSVDLPADDTLRPGMFLQAAIVTETATGLTVPMEAVLPQNDGNGIVYRLEADDTVSARTVSTGELLPGGNVEILSGLSSGDRVAVKGAPYLQDGDRVQAIEAPALEASS